MKNSKRSVLYKKSDYKRECDISVDDDKHHNEYRSEFRRDYARLIHSAAFRRLQGKTQLFPGIESDFFRNRLTHSIEVAQIAKSIAIKLNSDNNSIFNKNPINLDLVETAGLAHDLGHPPFGHNGERALDDYMKRCGGFEGNAQTLRILTRLEKKVFKTQNSRYYINKYGVDAGGNDLRAGLNLTYRTLASVLKYDSMIPAVRNEEDPLRKGYYDSESGLVKNIKQSIIQKQEFKGKFKTIECQIMDIADDIAYSTYDLEDALKAEFITSLDLITSNKQVLQNVTSKVSKNIGEKISDGIFSDAKFNKDIIDEDTIYSLIFFKLYAKIFSLESFEASDSNIIIKLKNILSKKTDDIKDFESLYRAIGINNSTLSSEKINSIFDYAVTELISVSYKSAIELGQAGHLRTRLTSDLINDFISGVKLYEENKKVPALSLIKLEEDTFILVEILKHFVFELITMSPRLRVVEYRGYEIVESIFKALTSDEGHLLLPDDFRALYTYFKDDEVKKKRVICDFVAGMTDRYAIEFYSRLKSENAQTIFKPI